MVSVHVYQVWAFLHLHFKRNIVKQRHTKKAKMGYLDSIDLEHCSVFILFYYWVIFGFISTNHYQVMEIWQKLEARAVGVASIGTLNVATIFAHTLIMCGVHNMHNYAPIYCHYIYIPSNILEYTAFGFFFQKRVT